jgi:hypothetical protein
LWVLALRAGARILGFSRLRVKCFKEARILVIEDPGLDDLPHQQTTMSREFMM